MKKVLFVLIAALAIASSVLAQQYKIEKSAGFEEPESGWSKVQQLKNGNTIFLHIENKEGMLIVVYDASRKEISRKSIKSNLWDADRFNDAAIAGIYEINGDAVLFLVQVDKELKLSIYRIQISAATGDIIKEDVAGCFPPEKSYKRSNVANIYSQIMVEKDPASDCYAIILKKLPANTTEYLRVLHYSGSHELLNDTYYAPEKGDFSSLYYIGCAVDGDKRVIIVTSAETTTLTDTTKGLLISCLKRGEKKFQHKLTEFPQDLDGSDAVMRYNPSANIVQLITYTFLKSKRKFNILLDKTTTTTTYLTLMFYLDPEALAITKVKALNGEKINEYAHKKIDPEYSFGGAPQQLIINEDNSATVIFEEVQTQTITRSNNYGSSSVVREDTYIGAFGISELSDTGSELRGYAINKKQMTQGILPKFYIAQRSKGVYMPPPRYYGFHNTFHFSQFTSTDYIITQGGRYAIFNDLPVNFEKSENEKKRKLMNSVSESNTICCKLGDGNIDKFYLFGEPKGYETIYCYITSSDYNHLKKSYATLLVEHIGRKKEAKIAWVTFE